MVVQVMSVFEYDNTGWKSQRVYVTSPTWEQLKDAIERMDKFYRPCVWLFLRPDVDEEDVPDFDFAGGSGDYLMSGPTPDGRQRRFVRHQQEGPRVVIQTSDQGWSVHPRLVCHDLDVVLRVAKNFFETGQFDQNVTWEI